MFIVSGSRPKQAKLDRVKLEMIMLYQLRCK